MTLHGATPVSAILIGVISPLQIAAVPVNTPSTKLTVIGASPVKSVPPLTSLFPEQCASLKAVILYVPVFNGETENV